MPASSKPVQFEGIGFCFYEIIGKREPRRNEFYLSGAVVGAWRAPNDLSSPYVVVRPTNYATTAQHYVKGEPVKLTPGGLPLPRFR